MSGRRKGPEREREHCQCGEILTEWRGEVELKVF